MAAAAFRRYDICIPSWQVTTAAWLLANCSQTYRNGPDVSANANFTFYVCADQTTCTANEYGGTSFAAPMWAGFLALVNQQVAVERRQHARLHQSGHLQHRLSSSYDSDFHDITSGSNGFSATTGYDLATGWGSPNGTALITGLLGGTTSNPSFTISVSPTKISVAKGASGTATITTTVSGGFNSAITLTATGQGSKQTVTFSPNPIAAPGSGTSTMTIKVGSSATTGNKKMTITGTGGGLTQTTTFTLDVIN